MKRGISVIVLLGLLTALLPVRAFAEIDPYNPYYAPLQAWKTDRAFRLWADLTGLDMTQYCSEFDGAVSCFYADPYALDKLVARYNLYYFGDPSQNRIITQLHFMPNHPAASDPAVWNAVGIINQALADHPSLSVTVEDDGSVHVHGMLAALDPQTVTDIENAANTITAASGLAAGAAVGAGLRATMQGNIALGLSVTALGVALAALTVAFRAGVNTVVSFFAGCCEGPPGLAPDAPDGPTAPGSAGPTGDNASDGSAGSPGSSTGDGDGTGSAGEGF